LVSFRKNVWWKYFLPFLTIHKPTNIRYFLFHIQVTFIISYRMCLFFMRFHKILFQLLIVLKINYL
jgi:hypothetical protein